MQIYLAAAPGQLRDALAYTGRIAHAAYRIGPDGRLARQGGSLPAGVRGGLLVLGDREAGLIRDQQALCRDVWRECAGRGFAGVAADFEEAPRGDRAAFLEALGRVLGRNGKQLFVPEAYGGRVPQALVLLCTALSGGTLRGRLEEAGRTFGTQRLALDLQRLRMSFPLPCPSGEGEPLSGEALAELRRQKQPSLFYSADLCARYFTCGSGSGSRFVLFDDAGTLRRKIQLGRELGIAAGFLQYPEVSDLLPELFSNKGQDNFSP